MEVIFFALIFLIIYLGISLIFIYHVTKESSKDALYEYKEEIMMLIKEEIQNTLIKSTNNNK